LSAARDALIDALEVHNILRIYMINKGFIENEDLLRESCEVEDLLDFSNEIEQFKKKIAEIKNPSILGLVGPFGVGKSTMLFQIEKELEKKENVLWVNFDAWKYPERRDLWEGFVLDFAKKMSPEDFKEADKKLRGEQNDDKKTLVKVLSCIPGFSALEGLNHFFKTSPARRVDDIQSILKEQIKGNNKDIHIVVEDIDRSGDSGIFFLETLKQFISNLDTDKKFIVIVPISDVSYYLKLESYLKSIDYFDFFKPNNIKLEKFVNQVFSQDFFKGEFKIKGTQKIIWTGKKRRLQIVSFLEGLFRERKEMSMRLLKLIIRKANLAYINQTGDGHEPDLRVTLCIEASKYFYLEKESERNYFNDFKRDVHMGNNIFSSFVYSMFSNNSSIYKEEFTEEGKRRDVLISAPYNVKFVDREESNIEKYPSYPWIFENPFTDREEKKFGVASFYLEY